MSSLASLEVFKALLAELHEPLLLARPTGEILAANIAAAEALAAGIASLEGKPLRTWCPDPTAVDRLKSGASFPLRSSDGRRFFCEPKPLSEEIVLLRLSGDAAPLVRARAFSERLTEIQLLDDRDGEPHRDEELARRLLTDEMSAIGAITAGVFGLAPSGDALELKVAVGVADDTLDMFASFPLSLPLPMSDCARRGEPVYFATAAELDAQYPELKHTRPRTRHLAIACLPMRLERRLAGVLALGFPTPWQFTEEDRGTFESLAVQCARLFAGRRTEDLRAGGQRSASRLERLTAFAGSLAGALTETEVGDVLFDMSLAVTSAQGGGLWVLSEDGSTAQLIRTFGVTGPQPENHVRVPLDPPGRMPILDVMRSGQPRWIESCEMFAELYPEMARTFPARTDSALACVPLFARGRCVGGLALRFGAARKFRLEHRSFLKVIAWHAAQALERTRLYAAEQRARAEAEALRRRSDFLADVSMVLASSLDFSETLSSVARAAVPRIADWSFVQLADPAVPPLAEHVDPALAPVVLQMCLLCDVRSAQSAVGVAIREGKSSLYRAAELAQVRTAFGNDPRMGELMDEAQLKAAMVVPLTARGRTLGAIVLGSSRPDRTFDEHDLAMGEELGHRVGVAVDNARLYREALKSERGREHPVPA